MRAAERPWLSSRHYQESGAKSSARAGTGKVGVWSTAAAVGRKGGVRPFASYFCHSTIVSLSLPNFSQHFSMPAPPRSSVRLVLMKTVHQASPHPQFSPSRMGIRFFWVSSHLLSPFSLLSSGKAKKEEERKESALMQRWTHDIVCCLPAEWLGKRTIPGRSLVWTSVSDSKALELKDVRQIQSKLQLRFQERLWSSTRSLCRVLTYRKGCSNVRCKQPAAKYSWTSCFPGPRRNARPWRVERHLPKRSLKPGFSRLPRGYRIGCFVWRGDLFQKRREKRKLDSSSLLRSVRLTSRTVES